MGRQITKRDLATLVYMTLEEVANELGESVETVRCLCVRFERGLSGGLPSYHFGEVPVEEAERRLRRVHRRELDEFIRSRRAQQRVEVREEAKDQVRQQFRQARAGPRPKREWV